MKIFEGLGCVTSDERLEFDDDAFTIRIMTQIQEFLKEFFRCGMGAIVLYEICWSTPEIVDALLWNI